METSERRESSGTVKNTTKRLEWLGWFGVMGWLFCMINSYIDLPNGYSDDNIFLSILIFQILYVLSVIAVSLKFGRDPNGLGKLAYYTTPVAIVLTVVFTVIPQPAGPILFAISPIFMAPATVRRAYGILRTATPGRTLFTYMSGVAVGFLLMQVILNIYERAFDYEAPTEIAFVIFAVLALLAWLGVHRTIDITVYERSPVRRRPPKSLFIGIAALLLVAFWLRQMNNFINYAILTFDEYLFIPVYVILPPVVYVLFGFWGDRGHEKKSILVGLILLLVAIQFAFLVNQTHSAMEIPLIFINHFIGNYLVYFIITISASFMVNSKRPVFTASMGFVVYIVARLFNLITGEILPEAIQTADAPLFVSTAITSIAFFLLLYFFYQRQQRESTLADALYAMLYTGQGGGSHAASASGDSSAFGGAPDETADFEMQSMTDVGLTPDEIKVAELLIEGKTRSEILRNLHISAADVSQHEKAIRRKLLNRSGSDEATAIIVVKYGLTKREAEMLQYLRQSKSNKEISTELFISEETIRIHIRNLLKKLPVETRTDIAAWVESLESPPDPGT